MMRVIALIAFGVTTIAVWWSMRVVVGRLWPHDDQVLPPREERRRMLYRMGMAVGWWLVATGLCIVAIGGMWVSAIGPLGFGLMWLASGWLSRRYNIAPWWAPDIDR